jgi:hypothetical protein
MTALDLFALLILIVITVVVLALIYFLGSWPGRVARARKHPEARAIEVGGWATLAFGGLFWPLVLIWAFREPSLLAPSTEPESEFDAED